MKPCTLAVLGVVLGLTGCVASKPDSGRVFGSLQNEPGRAAAQAELGIRAVVFGVNWSRFEPRPGEVDMAYVERLRENLRVFRAAGSLVCLDFAMHYPPAWVFEQPHSRYVNQYGQEYRDAAPGKDFANGIFNRRVREAQRRHVANVFAALGTDFYGVRLGWSEYGELCYPRARYDDRRNCFWAYDEVAQGRVPDLLAEGLPPCPVPGWQAGAPSEGNAAARQFADWYLGCLENYQNWQIGVVRRHFTGPLIVMYPSWGLRPGELERLVGRDLASDTQEIQRGMDYARLTGSLRDADIVVYSTWMDGHSPQVDDESPDPGRWSPMRYLAHLAHDRQPRLHVWGENSARPSDAAAMRLCFERMGRYDIQGMIWAFERNLYDPTGTYASLEL
ncbi:MAG: hypothetical protein RBU25_04095, partial [Lentisphaeria bacterium]|nr:hypothetical protein [Lentisphaeria bacterium]